MSGPSALDGLEFLMADSTWLVVRVMGVVFRLCSCLSVCRLDLLGVKFVGFVKCLLNALAMSLLELNVLILFLLIWTVSF